MPVGKGGGVNSMGVIIIIIIVYKTLLRNKIQILHVYGKN